MQAYATTLKDGTPAQIAAFYAPEGELLLPGLAPLATPKGIEAFLAPLVKQAKVTDVTVQCDPADVNGASATLWGTYSETYVPTGGAAQTVTGRFASAWVRGDEGGGWKLRRLMMQPAPPPK